MEQIKNEGSLVKRFSFFRGARAPAICRDPRAEVHVYIMMSLPWHEDMRHRQAFKITARDLGDPRPGLSLDNVAELIEQVEGSLHR